MVNSKTQKICDNETKESLNLSHKQNCSFLTEMSSEEIKEEFEKIGRQFDDLSSTISTMKDQQGLNAQKLEKISNAIDGVYGLPGLVSIVIQNDKRLKELENISVKQGVFISVLTGAITVFIQYILK